MDGKRKHIEAKLLNKNCLFKHRVLWQEKKQKVPPCENVSIESFRSEGEPTKYASQQQFTEFFILEDSGETVFFVQADLWIPVDSSIR